MVIIIVVRVTVVVVMRRFHYLGEQSRRLGRYRRRRRTAFALRFRLEQQDFRAVLLMEKKQ